MNLALCAWELATRNLFALAQRVSATLVTSHRIVKTPDQSYVTSVGPASDSDSYFSSSRGRASCWTTSSSRAAPFRLRTYPLAPLAAAHSRSLAWPWRVYTRTFARRREAEPAIIGNKQGATPLLRYISVTTSPILVLSIRATASSAALVATTV